MDDFASIIRTIGDRQLAERLNVSTWAVTKWRQRGRIPASHLQAVLEVAQQHGIAVTAEQLLDIAAKSEDAA